MEDVEILNLKGKISRSGGQYYVDFGINHFGKVGILARRLNLLKDKGNIYSPINWAPIIKDFSHKYCIETLACRFPEFESKEELINFVNFLKQKINEKVYFINLKDYD